MKRLIQILLCYLLFCSSPILFAQDEFLDEDFTSELDDSESLAQDVGTDDFDDLEPLEEPEEVNDFADAEDDSGDWETEAEDEVAEESFFASSGDQFDDSPDSALEARLHNIYLNFHNSRTSDEEWNALVGERQVESYQIQKGDNLWNISTTFFGDGNYWPKVWSLNSSIQNPHLINESNSIRFMFGTESEPPAFTIAESPSGGSAAPAPQITSTTATGTITTITQAASSSDFNEGLPDIPPPLRASRPVLRRIPPSLPEWQDQSQLNEYDDLGIDYGRRKILDIEDKIFLSGYISETKIDELGKVHEVEVGHNIASSYQYVYVAMNKGAAEIGDTFLAVRNRGPVVPVVSAIKARGYAIDVQGEIQLVEKVTSKDDSKKDMFRALVLQIVNPVAIGASLIKGEIERVEMSERGPRSQVVAEIIGGVLFDKRQIYATESIAFLNRGERDGLEVGQVLPIRANFALRNQGTRVRSNIRPIGWLRIIRTTPTLATAVIVRAWSDVITGDLTGSGELMPTLGMVGTAGDGSAADDDLEFEEDFEEEDF